jgi:hypothetical protein
MDVIENIQTDSVYPFILQNLIKTIWHKQKNYLMKN